MFKNVYYNKQPLLSKKFALESMLTLTEGYKNLCTAIKNTSRINTVLENFVYRLTNLNEKVSERLNK